MRINYGIHLIGTPILALPNTPGYWESQWWSNEDGWGHKSTSDIFDTKDLNLPLDGEWVEIYLEERIG